MAGKKKINNLYVRAESIDDNEALGDQVYLYSKDQLLEIDNNNDEFYEIQVVKKVKVTFKGNVIDATE
jgi:hypothetical protein